MVTPATSGLRTSSGAPAGVATTCTGPRRASSAMSGVVSTTSPRNEVWMTRENCTAALVSNEAAGRPRRRPPRGAIATRGAPELVDLQYGEERFLWNLDGADLLHALLPFFLLLEELPFPRDVAAIALREDVLAERLHR